ncbi:MAG: ribosome maturation factor [Bacteroidetes bacterium]|nr:ribosome maturation factor [Bacteroidota bacterium]
MTVEQKIEVISGLATAILPELETDCFLVEVRLKPGNKIQVFLDADAGISLGTCTKASRKLYPAIEAAGLFEPGNFELEVSSPGLDEPLKLPRQYLKNMGRPVEVVLKDGRKISGKLIAADATSIQIEETKGKGKKQEIILHHLLTETIKTTKIQIVF